MAKHTFFLSYRTDLFKRYEGLFEQGDGQDEDEPEFTGQRMTVADAQMEQREKAKRKWSWIAIIYNLSGGDITKANEIVNKKFTECLIWLSYKSLGLGFKLLIADQFLSNAFFACLFLIFFLQ